MIEKAKIRKEILHKLKSQSKDDVLRKSAVIKKRLFELEEFRKARCVIFYVSMPHEVDTHQMIDESIQMGKVVGVPVVIKGENDLTISRITDRLRQLEKGPYGISQPKLTEINSIPYEDMELVLVPGLAFDKDGNRLGRGKGYYDRFLKKLAIHVLTIGLCFDFQVLDSIPRLPHDIPLKMLLTNAY
ncbi:MAG: 5-formyltetrahydrofolate cyclo-ligase [Candidatus Omnitrophica bacterium]|nr:5-formyltetrahydrofolate cyclo-ligase [Candidatus Omnitrophota bacterium]